MRPINPARGEQLPQSKLTAAQVITIRRNVRGEPARVWAERLDVSQTTIYKIWHGQSWGHLK